MSKPSSGHRLPNGVQQESSLVVIGVGQAGPQQLNWNLHTSNDQEHHTNSSIRMVLHNECHIDMFWLDPMSSFHCINRANPLWRIKAARLASQDH
jgi:hypothetical protein